MPKQGGVPSVVVLFRENRGPLDQLPDGSLRLGRKPIPGFDAVLKTFPGSRAILSFRTLRDWLPLLRQQAQQASGRAYPSLNHFARVYAPSGTDFTALSAALGALGKSVERTWLAGEARPAEAGPPAWDYSSMQCYLDGWSAGGVGARAAWNAPGGTAAGVRICDVEWGYDRLHPDLPPIAVQYGGTACRRTSMDHGTSVLSLLGAPRHMQQGILGITGIAHGACLGFCSVMDRSPGASADNSEHLGTAAMEGAKSLSAGDILLLEVEIKYAGGKWGPVEGLPDVGPALSMAADTGIIVIEPAGNSTTDLTIITTLDNEQPWGPGATRTQAIIVGAGAAPVGGQAARSVLAYSNYGDRVDCQGWGNAVITAAGNHGFGPSGYLDWGYFDGTSAAGAMVAGVAACLQGLAFALLGRFLTPRQARWVLRHPRMSLPQPVSDAAKFPIGPLPNLELIVGLLRRYRRYLP